MTEKSAMDLLNRTLVTQQAAAEQLAKCQAQGPDLFKSSRDALEMDQREMAAALGIHATYLSKIENGKTPPGLHLLEALRALIERRSRIKG